MKVQQLRKLGQRGFTLMEILVVLVLLGIIMGVVSSKFMGQAEKAKTDAAKIQIQQVAQSLDLFKLEVGRYPTQSEGLQALIAAPSGLSRWNGPYWKENKVPKDPWNNDFKYVSPGKNGTPYEVISSGSDGKEISSADL